MRTRGANIFEKMPSTRQPVRRLNFPAKGGFGGCSLDHQNRNEGIKNGTTVPQTRTRVQKTERRYKKTGTRAHSPKPTFYKAALFVNHHPNSKKSMKAMRNQPHIAMTCMKLPYKKGPKELMLISEMVWYGVRSELQNS